MNPGTRVCTVKPGRESTDWTHEAKAARKWGVLGTVRARSDKHGLIFRVEHDDGTEAWYESRELQELNVNA